MKYNVLDLKESYSGNLITISGTFQILDDDSNELWSKGISERLNVNAPGGVQAAKERLLAQAQDIKNTYIKVMGKMVAETGKSSVGEMLADVSEFISGGIK